MYIFVFVFFSFGVFFFCIGIIFFVYVGFGMMVNAVDKVKDL